MNVVFLAVWVQEDFDARIWTQDKSNYNAFLASSDFQKTNEQIKIEKKFKFFSTIETPLTQTFTSELKPLAQEKNMH